MHEQQRTIGALPAPPLVFLADDDDVLRLVLKEELVTNGYHVEDVGDGALALELLSMAADGLAPAPAVVILDVRMPGYSGLGVLNVMRRFERRPPTLLLTGVPDLSIDVLGRALGAYRVLHKPIELSEVLAVVRDAASSVVTRSTRV